MEHTEATQEHYRKLLDHFLALRLSSPSRLIVTILCRYNDTVGEDAYHQLTQNVSYKDYIRDGNK